MGVLLHTSRKEIPFTQRNINCKERTKMKNNNYYIAKKKLYFQEKSACKKADGLEFKVTIRYKQNLETCHHTTYYTSSVSVLQVSAMFFYATPQLPQNYHIQTIKICFTFFKTIFQNHISVACESCFCTCFLKK